LQQTVRSRSSDPSGSERIFQPDSRGSDYFSQPGDHGTLTNNFDGTFTLTEADGTQTHFLADGQVDYLQDTNGNRITAVYTNGLLTSLTHSSRQFLDISYNAAGLVTSVTDSDGRVTHYNYDSANQHLLSVTAFDGRTTSYAYDGSSNPFTQNALLSVSYPDGTHTYFNYDPQGRLDGTERDGGAEPLTFTIISARSPPPMPWAMPRRASSTIAAYWSGRKTAWATRSRPASIITTTSPS
jgi:YD repeat-containing protein